ncbi:MAG TPA: hypothetical protein VIO37_10525 [Candidatus Dormibacteraeota bacterium]|jgi:hypothetical protein
MTRTKPTLIQQAREFTPEQDAAFLRAQNARRSKSKVKLYVVLDCEIIDPKWTPQDIMDNVPDYVETLCGKFPASMDYRHEMDAYILSDPTVYVSLEDFDSDRAEKIDHFAEEKK